MGGLLTLFAAAASLVASLFPGTGGVGSPTAPSEPAPVLHFVDHSVSAPDGDATELLERFAPAMAVRTQSTECGDGESYYPLSVDHVLGNSDVVLRDGHGNVAKTAPTAADLASVNEEPDATAWALDLPGHALAPGCTYERWYRAMNAEPQIYGRLVVDEGQLVAQYWFYCVFNDWNDRHESDWEMAQLVFASESIADALESGPVAYSFAQHEGATIGRPPEPELPDARSPANELLDQLSSKVAPDTVILSEHGHPIVYVAEGSHSSHFDRGRWFGRDAASGFGCDNTTPALTLLTPGVIELPVTTPTDGEFAWLSYPGHWGERQEAFNDGPTGPATKQQWNEPLEWMREKAVDTYLIPFGGTPSIDMFCHVTAGASTALFRLLDYPVPFAILAGLAVAFVVLLWKYANRGVLRPTLHTYATNAERLALAGGAALVGWAARAGKTEIIERLLDRHHATPLDEAWSAWVTVLDIISAAITVVLMVWAAATAVQIATASRVAKKRWTASWRTYLTTVATTGAVIVSLLALPLVAFVPGRYLIAPAVSAATGQGVVDSFRQSRRELQGHRLKATALTLVIGGLLFVPSLTGAVMMLVLDVSFAVAAVIAAGVSALTLPLCGVLIAELQNRVTDAAGSLADVAAEQP